MDNVSKLREACRVWDETKGAKSEKWIELMAEDVAFGSLAGGTADPEFIADCAGKERVRRYLAELVADWEMLHFTPEEFLAEGDRVVMRGKIAYKNRTTGKAFQSPIAQFTRFRDGKIIEFFEFFDTAKVRAAATQD